MLITCSRYYIPTKQLPGVGVLPSAGSQPGPLGPALSVPSHLCSLPRNITELVCRCGGRMYVHVPGLASNPLLDEKTPVRGQKPLSAIRLDYVADKQHEHSADTRCLRPAFIPVLMIVIITSLVVFLPLALHEDLRENVNICTDQCKITLVESIPDNLTYPAGSPLHPTIFQSWMRLMDLAKERLEIASFYWTLTGQDIGFETPSDVQGETVLKRLMQLGTEGGVDIHIVQNKPRDTKSKDIAQLLEIHAATVRTIDFDRLFGAGVLHTKLWIVDRTHFFVGSANMDWRSLTQVKELGVLVEDCSCLAEDAGKLMDVYWYLGAPNATIPDHWPRPLETKINAQHPANVTFNSTSPVLAYMASSPPPFCPDGRTTDLDAILDIIQSAESYINVAVMDYYPSIIYVKPKKFWPRIDDALRSAALDRSVTIRLLASKWHSTRPDMLRFLASLQALNGTQGASIHTKLFITPAVTPEQVKIPFARVNHNKYMVTDKTAYIGTSNWSGDYFVNTGGVSIAVSPRNASSSDLRAQLKAVFDRDWNSQYAHDLDGLPPTNLFGVCP